MNYKKIELGKQLGIKKRIKKNDDFYWYSYAVQKIENTYIVYECEITEKNITKAMDEEGYYEYENINKYQSIEEVERNFIEKYDIRFSDIGPLKGQHIFNPLFYL